jgi:8-oxo-dGTP diphosphatase
MTKKSYYKLPGGGIEPGEHHETALRREVLEETGYSIENIRDLETVEEYRNHPGIHQISYCFVADTAARKGTADLDAYEIDQGFRLEWLDIESAIKTMERHPCIDDYHARFIALRDLTFLKEAAKSKP